MANEIDRLLKQQRDLEKLADPLRELRRGAELFSASRPDFLYKDPLADLMRGQQQVDTILKGLAPGGNIARMLQNIEGHRVALDETVRQAKQIGLLGAKAPFEESIAGLMKAQHNIDQFRLPEVRELSALALDAVRLSKLHARDLYSAEAGLADAMARMHTPWVAIEAARASVDAFARIVAMGRGLQTSRPFEDAFVSDLRENFGDWRAPLPSSTAAFDSQLERSAFYVEQGFDSALTAFVPAAFGETLDIAGLREQAGEGDDESVARAREIFDQLARLRLQSVATSSGS